VLGSSLQAGIGLQCGYLRCHLHSDYLPCRST